MILGAQQYFINYLLNWFGAQQYFINYLLNWFGAQQYFINCLFKWCIINAMLFDLMLELRKSLRLLQGLFWWAWPCVAMPFRVTFRRPCSLETTSREPDSSSTLMALDSSFLHFYYFLEANFSLELFSRLR